MRLTELQKNSIGLMNNGSILCGDVGSGKSFTSLGYYYKENGGDLNSNPYIIKNKNIIDLIIITTAATRDKGGWHKELKTFKMSISKDDNYYNNNIIVDSWANIKKYKDIKNAFFIFDEQKLTGSGTWVKTFYHISKNNKWIILSATPGDEWLHYAPVFIANGYFKNITEFKQNHVLYHQNMSFPLIKGYYNTIILEKYRDKLLISLPDERKTKRHLESVIVDYDIKMYKEAEKTRWNPYTNLPFETSSEMCFTLRKIVNSDISRFNEINRLLTHYNKIIIFYNFNYELDILRNIETIGHEIGEWNGHRHDKIPSSDKWVYLVQYTAGAEGWNCIDTNIMIFYSQNSSYRIVEQSMGRIDRMNTPFIDLYYITLKSNAPIDNKIATVLRLRKKFNEKKAIGW